MQNGKVQSAPMVIIHMLPDGHADIKSNIADPLMVSRLIAQAQCDWIDKMAVARQKEASQTVVGPDGRLPTLPKGG